MTFNTIPKDKLMEPFLEMVWISDILYRRFVSLQYIHRKLLYFRSRMAHLSQQHSIFQTVHALFAVAILNRIKILLFDSVQRSCLYSNYN